MVPRPRDPGLRGAGVHPDAGDARGNHVASHHQGRRALRLRQLHLLAHFGAAVLRAHQCRPRGWVAFRPFLTFPCTLTSCLSPSFFSSLLSSPFLYVLIFRVLFLSGEQPAAMQTGVGPHTCPASHLLWVLLLSLVLTLLPGPR